jgi:hypothetical protein
MICYSASKDAALKSQFHKAFEKIQTTSLTRFFFYLTFFEKIPKTKVLEVLVVVAVVGSISSINSTSISNISSNIIDGMKS